MRTLRDIPLVSTLLLIPVFILVASFARTSIVRAQPPAPLTVCSDPDYLPYSNSDGSGFENAIAKATAKALGVPLKYYWYTERGRGGWGSFVVATLNAKKCDVIVDVPSAYPELLTTKPYYISSYVFAYQKNKNYDLTSMDSPALRKLKIGFEVDTPGEDGLKIRDLILKNTIQYAIGDTPGASPRQVLQDIVSGKIDVAIMWAPAIAPYIKNDFPQLTMVTVPNTRSLGAPEQYIYPMSMAVRQGDTALAERLNGVIAKNQAAYTAIFHRFGIPLYSGPGAVGLER